ncbi:MULTISPECIES: SDR family oxidoreductase [Roseobacteraceae]|jgi:glucose 1-dehydrogenase|uniref:General stress protein 39 n=1 Tax=Pseudosulfitobacter pseudonitzschiae TaxID=1402135 RepID=A0A221K1F3_9RHOB|nr:MULTISPECIES: SDR family oxidoreductase [Roseobacteraceae]ASM72720.1 general stress protein 39 [Pseudosulfitobacter pseudonitzschiae]
MSTPRPVCLITGASAGIGAACAELAARRGYDLLLTYRRDATGAAAVRAKAEAAGARVVLVQADVAEPADIDRIFATLDADFGRIDALVNNAGAIDTIARLTDMDHARLTRIFAVNVIGAMLVAKAAVQRMEAQGSGGNIVNISSAAARLGSGGQFVDYAATKGAIDTFTKGLSDEVAPNGIRVNAVRPGIIKTDIHGKAGAAERVDELGPMTPMRRSGSAAEVAASVLYLMSDDASYVTGTFLDVTGGR